MKSCVIAKDGTRVSGASSLKQRWPKKQDFSLDGGGTNVDARQTEQVIEPHQRNEIAGERAVPLPWPFFTVALIT